MAKKVFLFFIVLGLFLLIPPVYAQVKAASLKFDKTTQTVSVSGTLQLQVIVDAGTYQVLSTDAYVLYDSTILQVKSVTAGTYFPTVSNDTSTAGKVYIAGMVNDPATSASGSGTLATITFQALNNGQTTLTFDCNTSKIISNDVNATNVMQCAQNGSSVITVGTGSTGLMTTPEATPSALPRSGVFENVTKLAIPGILLLFIGLGSRLLL